jgi:predicted phage baseplate assembly protein
VPIQSPQLDDLRFQTVADQLRRQIALFAPEWTDHNDSDPGITMLQLFAHLAEQIGYRLNQVPDKVYIELLKLVGIRLRPAAAATTTLAFYLTKPELATAFAIPNASRVKAKTGNPPPTFETTIELDAVPAQLAAIVSTESADLRDIAAGTPAIQLADTAATYVPDRFALEWDGRTPKLKDWPQQPVSILARPNEAGHTHLWLGLAFNPSVAAGFLGQRVTLTVQLDDDEQPDPLGLAACNDDLDAATADVGPTVSYIYYRPPQPGQALGSWQPLSVLSDSTAGWTRSGQLRLDVPHAIGAIPDGEWVDVRQPSTMTTAQICAQASGTGSPPPKPIAHPLIGALKTPVVGTPTKVPVSGWVGIAYQTPPARFALRAVTFNAAPAIAATTVTNELVASGDGRSDQTVRLASGDVLPATLELLVEDVVDQLYYAWARVDDFDTAGPDDRVYVLDPEAGLIYFGDGVHGRLPGLGARIVASSYRWGGGLATELGAGTVTQGQALPSSVQDVTNPVAARGGRDAETLDQAKKRAPQALKTLGRAVTADDFDFLARQTTGARIVRTAVIPLRRPYQAEGIARAGVDMDRVAPGAISLIVVPGGDGLHLEPTEGVLRTVCRFLDKYRLITTELYVVPPQYVRIFDLEVTVVVAPGYSRTQLRETIATRFETYFHVLHGGADGTGSPFGGTIYYAELVAQAFRAEGVERVERLTARYDGNAPAPPGEPSPMSWRPERATARNLVGCPTGALDDDRVDLFADECVFVDSSTLNVIVLT